MDTARRKEITRIVGLAVLAYFLLASYAIARPATESLFLEAYRSQDLPWVWLAVGVGASGAVLLYNRFTNPNRLMFVLGATSFSSALLLALLMAAERVKLPGATFLLYIWKDIYVVLLVEIFWSYANAEFQIRTAKWIYGLFCAMGSLGGLTANLGVGFVAEEMGTRFALWALVPGLGLLGLVCMKVSETRLPVQTETAPAKDNRKFAESFRLVRASRYLTLMLILIAVVQVVITLIDYRYNVALQEAYPGTDERTAVIGRVYGAIDVGALIFQALTGPILATAGVSKALLGIPAVLGMSIGLFLAFPQFVFLAVAKVASKCLDYSLFRAAKEILYIPLTPSEKTQGKAIIDVMTYRIAKGAASVLLLALIALDREVLALLLALGMIVGWILVTRVLTRMYRRLASE